VDMSELKGVTEDIFNTARDAAYVTVGLGVLAFQRAQVRRNELVKALSVPREDLEERLGEVRDDMVRRVKLIDEKVEEVIVTLETSIAPLEERLPEPAREIVIRARTQARDVRQQLRSLLTAA